MKIELTKEQFKTLMIIAYCGEWMLNSHKTKEDKLSKKTEDLGQLLYSFARETGLEKWIEYDAEMDKYFPTIEMEEELDIFIEKYNNRQRN